MYAILGIAFYLNFNKAFFTFTDWFAITEWKHPQENKNRGNCTWEIRKRGNEQIRKIENEDRWKQ